MGSPLEPALANIFIGFYKRTIPADEWPRMHHRYVDDVAGLCMVIPGNLQNSHAMAQITTPSVTMITPPV